MRNLMFVLLASLAAAGSAIAAEEAKSASAIAEKSLVPGVSARQVQEIVQRARESIVIIRFIGRQGQQQGLGTGFVIGEDGLIATNMHVLGEARPITVELADGRKPE